MQRKGTALSVSLGIIALAIAASGSLFVEGEATGTTVPGLHPTTEESISALVAGSDREQLYDAGGTSQAETPVQTQTQPAVQEPAAKDSGAGSGVPEGYELWKVVHAKVTAYEPSSRSCGKFANGKTSIGENAWVMDGVATDPKAIPYGSYVEIPGVGLKEVDDTGSAMRHYWRSHGRYQIDLRMTYYGQAKSWGVKYLDVKVYRKVK
jgi:3D (Asp-Asp-Asp) domain-containing protein